MIYQQYLSRKNTISAKKIELISAQLEQFYNPIIALLSENRVVFENLGPVSFPVDDGIRAEAAAEFWEKIRDQFVLPNNAKISDIIQSKSHLISKSDKLDQYMKLKLHIDAYFVFQDVVVERYAEFTFPSGIEGLAKIHRSRLIDELDKVMGGK